MLDVLHFDKFEIYGFEQVYVDLHLPKRFEEKVHLLFGIGRRDGKLTLAICVDVFKNMFIRHSGKNIRVN